MNQKRPSMHQLLGNFVSASFTGLCVVCLFRTCNKMLNTFYNVNSSNADNQ